MDPGETRTTSRIFTAPNVVTVLRLALLPVFVWLLLGQDDRIGASILLGFIGATDWVDGWLARRFDQVTELGKILDPVADRILFFVTIAAIVIDGGVPLWFCLVVVAREVVISLATLVLAALGARRIDVTWSGKAGTFFLMFAFPFLLLGAADFPGNWVATLIGWLCAAPGLALSYWAAVLYVPMGIEALREGRRARSSP